MSDDVDSVGEKLKNVVDGPGGTDMPNFCVTASLNRCSIWLAVGLRTRSPFLDDVQDIALKSPCDRVRSVVFADRRKLESR